jgi:hypothetical protein
VMASTERIGTGNIKENAADGAFIFHKLLVGPEIWLLPILLTKSVHKRFVHPTSQTR